MKIRHKVWLESDGKVIFGQGRQKLFRAVQACGSLNAAAKKLGMSYRAAWGRVRASEQRLGIPLVERSSHEKGGHLTPEAIALLDRFEQLEEKINRFIENASDQFAKSAFTRDESSRTGSLKGIVTCLFSILTTQLVELPLRAAWIETSIPLF